MKRLLILLDHGLQMFGSATVAVVEFLERFVQSCWAFLVNALLQREGKRKTSDRSLGESMEALEGVFSRLAQSPLTILTPWRWFSRQKTDVTQEFPREEPKSVDSVEFFVQKLYSHVTDVCSNVIQIVLPKPAVEAILKAQRALLEVVAALASWIVLVGRKVAERLLPDWLLVLLGRIARFGAAGIDFVSTWWWSRDFRKLAWSTPAFLLGVPVIVATALGTLYTNLDKIPHYRRALASATERRDQVEEELYLRKLTQLGYQQMERAEYEAAMGLAQDEEFQAAYERLQAIAPMDKPGYLWAHIWIAQALLYGWIDEEHVWTTLETHVGHVLAQDVDNVWAKRCKIEVDLHHERNAEAIQGMKEVADSFPDLHFELMQHYLAKQDLLAAKKHATRGTTLFEEQMAQMSDEAPRITAADYLRLAEAFEVLAKETDRLRILREGNSRYPENLSLQTNLASSLANRISAKDDLADPSTQEIVLQAMTLDAENPTATALLQEGIVNGDAAARSIVDELKQQGRLPATLLQGAGVKLFFQGEHPRAVECFQEVCEIDPNFPQAWNNIAWIWSNIEPLRLEDALTAVNRALEIKQDPEVSETKGQILVKLGRWQEATQELENALNGNLKPADRAEVHRALAIAYDKIGSPQLADAHRSAIGD